MGLVENNGSLPLSLQLISACGLTAKSPGYIESAMFVNQVWEYFAFYTSTSEKTEFHQRLCTVLCQHIGATFVQKPHQTLNLFPNELILKSLADK